MSDVKEFKNNLLFDIQKAFYDERGRGARYRLTRLGVDFLEENFDEKEMNIETVKKWLQKNNFCENLETKEDEISFSLTIEGCSLLETRKKFEENDMEILGCPIANMIMYLIEKKSGSSPELLPIETEGPKCKCTMAKMGTSDVVNEV